MVQWDPTDDMQTAQLLHTAGWGPELVARCQAAYDSVLAEPSSASLAESVMALLEHLGLQPPWHARRVQRAIFRRGPSSLSFDELLLGLVALDPTTAHGGVWNGLRAQYIFRTYDADEDGRLAPTELAQLLADVRRLYGNPPSNASDTLAEATALAFELDRDGRGPTGAPALSLAAFRAAVGQLRIRGCSRLFRAEMPLFRDSLPSLLVGSAGGESSPPRRLSEPSATPPQATPASTAGFHDAHAAAAAGASPTTRSRSPDSRSGSSRLEAWSSPPPAAAVGRGHSLDDERRFDMFAPSGGPSGLPSGLPSALPSGAPSGRSSYVMRQSLSPSTSAAALPQHPATSQSASPKGVGSASPPPAWPNNVVASSPAHGPALTPHPPLARTPPPTAKGSCSCAAHAAATGAATTGAATTGVAATGVAATGGVGCGGPRSKTHRGARGKRGGGGSGSEQPNGSPGSASPKDRSSGPSIWKIAPGGAGAAAPPATSHGAGPTAVTPDVVFPNEPLATVEPPFSIELPTAPRATSAAAGEPLAAGSDALHALPAAGEASADRRAAASLVMPGSSSLAVSTPADGSSDDGAECNGSEVVGAAHNPDASPPISPLSPNSPAGNGEVRFAFKKVVLEQSAVGDVGPRLVASRSGSASPTPPGLGVHIGGGAHPSLTGVPAPYPPADAAMNASTMSRCSSSVTIHPSDAALRTRKVGMQVSAWLPPPSPAPGKEVAKRIRDALLLSPWSAAALAGPSGVLGEGSLEYLCTDNELLSMCRLCVERKCWASGSLVKLRTPVKVFGDIHGQFADLMRFFAAYGSPNPYTGDIEYVSYCFLGDYVDRGKHSLEVICLLLALKICHPTMVTLLRGNHEDPQVNAVYGFRNECMQRCRDGATVWTAINRVFEWLPIAAVVDDTVLCVHGGIGESVQSLKQLRAIARPAHVDLSKRSVLNEVLWSDPTDSDQLVGCHPNARGPNTVSYGPDRVKDFCDANGLKLVVRAHQCVQDGFEWCAHGRLLTVFSAPDYGNRWRNDGAMLVLNRELHAFPKVLKSRGKAASSSSWHKDPKRPYTPPRPRPPQPRPQEYDQVDEQQAAASGGLAGGPHASAHAAAANATAAASSAVPAAHAVSVMLDASQLDDGDMVVDASPFTNDSHAQYMRPQLQPQLPPSPSMHPPPMQEPQSTSPSAFENMFAADEDDAASGHLAQQMAEQLLLS